MMASKRSRAAIGTEFPSKKQKQAAEEAHARVKAIVIENDTKMQLSAPNDTMAGLLHPKTILEFQRTYWEKDPVHIKRNDPSHYGTAFTRESMIKLLDSNELKFGSEVDAYRYVDGVKESFAREFSDKIVSVEDISKLLDEKQATVLFQQPQRYSDVLWNILEKMECFFGSLVGAHAYMTGARAEAFAPHCDDSESFVLQLEGSMHWSIYRPQVELAHGFTQDLSSDFKGELVLEAELKTGDLLYIPRGFIHQAVNKSDAHSTRLEISTYRHTSWGDFLNLAVSQAVENALDSQQDKTFRLGMPLKYGSYLGTGHNLQQYIQYSKDAPCPPPLSINEDVDSVKSFIREMMARLEKLGDHIDVNVAADALYTEFMNSRLPPVDLVPKQNYTAPKLTDSVVLKHNEHIHLTYYAADEGINTTCVDDEMTEDEGCTEDEECTEDEGEPEGNQLELKYEEEFRKFDLDGSGSISTKELETVMKAAGDCHVTAKQVESIINKADVDGSGSVKFEEFMAAVKNGVESQPASDIQNDVDMQQPNEKECARKTYMDFIKSLKDAPKPSNSCKSEEAEEDAHDHEYLIESDENQETCVQLIHSLNNSRQNHMLGGIPAKASTLKFGLHFASALTCLLSTNDYTTVSELPFLHDCDKLHLVKTLYNEDLLLVKSEQQEDCCER